MERSSDIAKIIEVGGYNCILNPSFEVDVNSWGGTGSGSTLTRITTDSKFGSACGRMTTSADDQWVEALLGRYLPGHIHIFSAYVKGTVDETIHLNVYTGSADDAGDPFTFTGEWQRITRQIILADSGVPKLQIRRYAGDTTHDVLIGGVMTTLGADLLTYFDGSFGTGYHWLGTAHNSVSYRNSRAAV